MSQMMWTGMLIVGVVVALMFAIRPGPSPEGERLTAAECETLQSDFDVVAGINDASEPGSDRFSASLAQMAGLERQLSEGGC